ncbi:MAG: BMP family ABC transporter substrate-binding protein, partial [Anaerolineae bacterium]
MSGRGDLLSKSRSARLGIALILALLFGAIFFCALEVGHPAQAQSSPHYVGLVTDEVTLADRSFNWLTYQGLLRAEAELDVVATVYTSTSSADYAPNLQQCVYDGNDLCLSVGFLTADAIWAAALDNLATSFAIVDHQWDEAYPPNLRSLTFAMDEAGYLAGTLAAEMTANDTVGVVGGIPVPSVVEYVEGYRSGARCANPNVNVFLDYAGSFMDPEYGAQTARWMMDGGADVIFGAAGRTGNGAILTATQSGAWGIGVDVDQYTTLFENGAIAGADYLLSSAMKHLDNGVYATIADLISGNFTAGTVHYDLAADGVGLAPFHETDPSVPQSVRDALAAVEQSIVSGTIDVYDPCQTPNLSARPSYQQIHAYNWPLWSMVTLTLDDPSTPGAPDHTDTQQVTLADWNPAEHFASFDLPEALEPGQVVTLTNGTYTKVHVVEPLAVTVVDPDADTVSGAAESGSDVNVWACDDWGCAGRHEVADVDGNWAADFSAVGDEGWEQETFDIRPGHWGDANVTDPDGDDTLVNWSLPNPRFGAWPDEERVDGWEWQANVTITVSVDGTVETAVSDEWGNFSLN